MKKNNILIAKKTLKLLENKSWAKIKIDNVINTSKEKSIRNKNALLVNINRYFDYMLNQNVSNTEKSSNKDMLFEVFMARLDILNTHRKSIKNLNTYLFYKPQELIRLIPSFVESIILIASHCNIDINGVKNIPKIKLLFILYIVIIYTWSRDETETLDKTMTTLDNYLSNLDKFIKL